MKRSMITAISLVLLTAAAAVAEVSGERPISEPAYGPPPGLRWGFAAASDGRDFLVAWVDSYRNQAAAEQIYAARMNAAGDILDPLGIRLPTLSHQPYQVDVVFLGEDYLVYWVDRSPVSPGSNALMGARVSRDGIVLDATPRMLADRATVNVYGSASNGNRTIIVFGGSMIALDRNANVIDGPRTISPDSAGASAAMVASNGHDFLVVWQRVTTITSLRIDANGVAASSTVPVTTSPFSQAVLDLASDGESYVTIVKEGFAVIAQHIGAAGELLEKSTVPLQQIFPGFAFTGGSYLLIDSDQLTIGVRRLNRAGQPVGSYVAVSGVSGRQGFGAGATLASNGSDAGFFWTDLLTSAQLFSATVVDGQSLAASKTNPIIRAAKSQTTPAAATSGRNHAVVWNENDGLYAGRITLDGQLLDGRGIRISNRAAAAPTIAYDGTNYVIAWIEQNTSTPPTNVKMARLSPDTGSMLDPAGIVTASGQWFVSVSLTPGPSSSLIAWSDGIRINANTVNRDGVLGMPVTVTPSDTANTGAVSTAWNGHEWLVVWEDLVTLAVQPDPGSGYAARIYSSRLSASLNVLDPKPIVVSNTLYDSQPFVSSNGDGFLIVWSRYLYPNSNVIAQRVSSDGSLLAQANGVLLSSGSAKSVAWDGLQYDVALSTHVFSGQETPYNLYVTHVAAAGSIESLNPLAVITNPIDPYTSLIVTGTGRATTVYTRVGSEPQYGDVERAFVSIPHVLRGRAASPR
ncbi:MAG TPA: hypothetical protein VNN08_14210 [Thermoanaerobaculia bacterium]|nr:hypothetical protein [Thermoanaerobaculia bacterium]